MTRLTAPQLASMIDHTLLKPEATEEQISRFCQEAKQHGFKSVCVNSSRVRLVADQLRGSRVQTCSVVGFPLGAMATAAKAAETKTAVDDGADEIDMVIAIGPLKDGQHKAVREDIRTVRDACVGKTLKVIIETGLLTDDEKRTACQLAKTEGADFVKTSTGFSAGGATVDDIALMRATVGPTMGVKASGGVRTLQAALAVIDAGANRIGTSSGMTLIAEAAKADATPVEA